MFHVGAIEVLHLPATNHVVGLAHRFILATHYLQLCRDWLGHKGPTAKAFCTLLMRLAGCQWYQDYSSSGSSQRVETLFIGVLKEEEEEKKKKEKDNQYKLKKAMATPLA